MSAASTILGTFPPGDFIRDYWQKKHLFLPGALAELAPPLSADELAGLACEEGIESRLVTHANENHERPWRLENGPFEEERFAQLGDSDWTLLVQDVDKFVPEVSQLLTLVNFLPAWSVDDIMISFAAPGGSVGPHTDRYDVFLYQASGTREWSISRKGVGGELRADAQLKVLAEFDAEETVVARPGDVLYLPPGVAHYGIAGEDCVTYSFGFRAPTQSMLLSAFADRLVVDSTEEQLKEVLDGPSAHPSKLSARLIADAQAMIEAQLAKAATDGRFLGRQLTEPKANLGPEALEEELSEEALVASLSTGLSLARDSSSRFLYTEREGRILLFVNGEDFDCGPVGTSETFVERLCGGAPIDAAARAEWAKPKRFLSILRYLVQTGALVYSP